MYGIQYKCLWLCIVWICVVNAWQYQPYLQLQQRVATTAMQPVTYMQSSTWKRSTYALRMSAPMNKESMDESTPLLRSPSKQDKNTSAVNPNVILASLLLVFASNQWCRQAIYYLCDFSTNAEAFKHINADLLFSQQQYAALASFGFTVIFTLFSLFAGSVADRNDRSVIIAISGVIWSIATALQSQAQSFVQLIPLRAIVGAAQAYFNPAAFTLIADSFPPEKVGTVNGIFSSGIFLGGALASLSIFLDNQYGWQNTIGLIGIVGVVISLLSLTIVRDNRVIQVSDTIVQEQPQQSQPSNDFIQNMQMTFAEIGNILQKSEVKLLLSASAIRFAAGFTIAIWKAPFIFAKFPESESLFAGSNAFIVAVGGFVSSLAGGYLSDQLAKKNTNGNSNSKGKIPRIWVSAAGTLLAAPFWTGFMLAPTANIALGFLLAEYLVAECWFGPTLATLYELVPSKSRGTAQGLFSFITAIGNLGPVLIGSLISKEGSFLPTLELNDALLLTVTSAYILSGTLFGVVGQRINQLDNQNNPQ